MAKLADQAKKLPLNPGVYMFLAKSGEILYIGRATSLRRRVASYFQKFLDPRMREMISKAHEVKAIKTETLLEAVILEANLIKEHMPRYNVKDRDNRSFMYIVIPKREDFPRPFVVRGREMEQIKPRDAHVFGPYQSFTIVKTALRLIRKMFPYSTCKANSDKPCIYYQIGMCPGVCIGRVSKEEYQKNIDNMVLLLSGQKKRLMKQLEKEYPETAKSLLHMQDVALMSHEKSSYTPLYRIEGYDISHLTGQETVGSMVVFINGEANNQHYRLFKVRGAQKHNDLEALEEVFRRRFKHAEWQFPDLILVDGGKPQIDHATKVFKDLKLNIPFVGISKYVGDSSRGSAAASLRDKLVFPKGMKSSTRALIETTKRTLLAVRDEAHRFALRLSRHQRRKKLK